MVHLRIHDKNYNPGYPCDFCDYKTKDNWHRDRHMLLHFKDTDVKSLNVQMPLVSRKNIQVLMTEVKIGNLRSTLYKMTLTDNTVEDTIDDSDDVDWDKAATELKDSFKQLGMQDGDWSDWQQLSSVMGLSPFEGFMSDIVYEKQEAKEIFSVSLQERSDLTEEEIVSKDDIEDLMNEAVCIKGSEEAVLEESR